MLSFVGIGAQKAGTTWLYKQLMQHPEISFPGGKEVHFWDRPSYRAKGTDWYCSLFNQEDNRIHGEITPAYAILSQDVIQEIFALFPGIKIIYLIRNPIQRAWSSAKMALYRAEMEMEEASDQWFIDHFRSAGSLARGDYERCLRNWQAVFPKRSFLVLRFEDLTNQPIYLLERCCDHLNIDKGALSAIESIYTIVFQGQPHPIRPSLLPVLHELYDAKINSLAAFLNQDLSSWQENCI